jgi:DNA processing protein
MKKTTRDILKLSLIGGVGPAVIGKLIKFISKQNSPAIDAGEFSFSHINFDQLFNFSFSDFTEKCQLTPKISQALVDGLKDDSLVEKEASLIEKYKIDLVTIFDEEYPESLRQIYLPPTILYCKGAKLSSFKKNISIVGSRKAGGYSKNVSEYLVKSLVANGWDTVSGGALGVDTMVHRATLEAGGKTIVVLGSGLMQPYPLQNKELFREVVKKDGVLVSPFPLNMIPAPGNFPARNRIISALGQGCILVQAAQKSGARITAKFALEQGKNVFAVPGPIYDELSIGCNELIQEGAKLINCVADVLEEFGEEVVQNYECSSNVENGIDFSKIGIAAKSKAQKSVKQYSDPILKCLDQALSIDDLSRQLDMEIDELQNKLFEFQLDGKVWQNFAGSWERV